MIFPICLPWGERATMQNWASCWLDQGEGLASRTKVCKWKYFYLSLKILKCWLIVEYFSYSWSKLFIQVVLYSHAPFEVCLVFLGFFLVYIDSRISSWFTETPFGLFVFFSFVSHTFHPKSASLSLFIFVWVCLFVYFNFKLILKMINTY